MAWVSNRAIVSNSLIVAARKRQGAEDRPLDFRYLGILHRIHERVLSVRGVILQLLCRVLLPERCDLVKVHLQVVGHLLGQLILGRRILAKVSATQNGSENDEGDATHGVKAGSYVPRRSLSP